MELLESTRLLERSARECVAVLRMEAGRTPHDSALSSLVGELSVKDPDFRTWWAAHQVRGPRQLVKTYHHPTAGTLTVDVQQFTVDTHPDQLLVACTAADDASREGLRLLLLSAQALPSDHLPAR